ncbi:unnamed protein product [Bursaphelenchus xylophilus]|uniref:(pine wood nematode) hypothetical protein n=1 Tax=Bursaphelenchus xylophilus TaxID=6326 RepID=A0A1I7S9J5_BURXY|nr:unnamed protein product [Bursaphelenchus xylophilus]CAG9111167.1 unnamed protein product [Bursaphelenchus xylophilus]
MKTIRSFETVQEMRWIDVHWHCVAFNRDVDLEGKEDELRSRILSERLVARACGQLMKKQRSERSTTRARRYWNL